jgi:hypothetical protein
VLGGILWPEDGVKSQPERDQSHPNCPTTPVSLGTFNVEVVDESSTNTTFKCGSVTNAATLQFTNIICVLESATPPAITNQFFSAAEAITNVVDCLAGMTNRTTNVMQYTETTRFAPSVPTNGFPMPGTFQFEIHVDGASPTIACPDLTAHAGTFTVIVSKVDIVETNVFACVTNLATFSVTPDSSSPIYWTISPDNGVNGAFFPNGNSGQTITIDAGPDPAAYTVTAHDQWTNCMDTATLTVQRLGLGLASTNVFVNSDDDDGDGVRDVDEPLNGPDSRVVGENNLISLALVTDNFPNAIQTITLIAPANVRLWDSNVRGPGAPVQALTWPANAVPSSFWVEGVQASAAVNDVQFQLTLAGGCSVATNFTVVDVASVVLTANVAPLTVNTKAGGGLALLPGRPTPTSIGDYSSVKVEVTLQPLMTGIQVHLKSFDVDDPSSGHAPPLDDETQAQDNKAANNLAGQLGGLGDAISVLTGANGVAWTNFNTTMHPGDNFRVIASPIAEFREHYQAIQTHAAGELALIGNINNAIPANYTTPMLTVWRRLHVEVDSMESVPVLANTVMGSITQIFGTQAAGATQAVLSVNLVNGLAPTDNSNNLDSNPPRNGRFENGTALIGQSLNLAVTQGLLGNGARFVRMPNGGAFDIPFTIVNSNGTVTRVRLKGGWREK